MNARKALLGFATPFLMAGCLATPHAENGLPQGATNGNTVRTSTERVRPAGNSLKSPYHVVFSRKDVAVRRIGVFDYDEWGLDLVSIESTQMHGKEKWQVECTTPFGIRIMAARTANELYVGGVDDKGNLIIERWFIKPRNGEIYQLRDRLASDVGEAATATSKATTWILGTAYVPVDQRTKPLPPVREQVFKGQLYAPTSLAVDPDGRFLIVCAGDPASYYQIEMNGQNIATPLTPPAVGVIPTPELAILERYTAGVTERVIATGFLPTNLMNATLYEDIDNDGVFNFITLGGLDLVNAFHEADGWENPVRN